MLVSYHIYAKSKCPFCVKAINLLHEMGYEFVLTLLDNSPEYYHKLKQKYEHRTVPMIVECDVAGNEKFIGGFTDMQDYFADYLNAPEDTEDSPSIPE
jgi:glutaredoxin